MLRRLHHKQPDSFAFTLANQAWAEAQITKYPEGRQASAIIPLLWRAQEQEGWLSRPAIEYVSDMLGLAHIRGLEVATFYFMFQLQPVGSVAHIQVCGTLSCMICGAEDLISVCREKIAQKPHQLSSDGTLSWEEVECLGACANAPMAQIGKDYYEDLTAEGFGQIIDDLRAGKVPVPGPQNGRFAAEPLSGVTSLTEYAKNRLSRNASAALATDLGDTVKRIDGSEVPIITPWRGGNDVKGAGKPNSEINRSGSTPVDSTGIDKREATATSSARPQAEAPVKASDQMVEGLGTKPLTLDSPKDGKADDLKQIKGIGPKLENLCNTLGFYHFDQIGAWSEQEIAWVDQNLEGFKGRVSRDNWVEQAKILASGGETEFATRVKKGSVYDT